ncbi:hypothetical protein F9Z84_06450 [Escherichia coli]|nr:hypothetical protein F9Z84_06450 [Escherichia coli]
MDGNMDMMEMTEADLNGQMPMCRMEREFLEFINYEFVKPFRKELIHILKNLAYHGEAESFFDLPIVNRYAKIRYEKDLILNQIKNSDGPTYLPGIVIPLETGYGPLVNLNLCISLTTSHSEWEYNGQYELQFRVGGFHPATGRVKIRPVNLFDVVSRFQSEM